MISIVRKQEPNIWEWQEVDYKVFDVPPLDTVFKYGIIDTPHYFKVITKDVLKWVQERETVSIDPEMLFLDRLSIIREYESTSMQVHRQTVYEDVESIYEEMDRLTELGAEGMILRRNTKYQCCRTHDMIKLKKLHDAEGTVIGYTTGRETEKGSKLLGRMGSLRIRTDDGVEFGISGFTDAERLLCPEGTRWAICYPDAELPLAFEAEEFPRGSRVTFKYRELSKDGVPKEARYFRKDNRH